MGVVVGVAAAIHDRSYGFDIASYIQISVLVASTSGLSRVTSGAFGNGLATIGNRPRLNRNGTKQLFVPLLVQPSSKIRKVTKVAEWIGRLRCSATSNPMCISSIMLNCRHCIFSTLFRHVACPEKQKPPKL